MAWLLSKIVVPKIESKSQRQTTNGILTICCYQRSLFLKLKANHNWRLDSSAANMLLSKIVVPKIESKSQPFVQLELHKCGCYQRSLFLKLKANHNPIPNRYSIVGVVIKDRCS